MKKFFHDRVLPLFLAFSLTVGVVSASVVPAKAIDPATIATIVLTISSAFSAAKNYDEMAQLAKKWIYAIGGVEEPGPYDCFKPMQWFGNPENRYVLTEEELYDLHLDLKKAGAWNNDQFYTAIDTVEGDGGEWFSVIRIFTVQAMKDENGVPYSERNKIYVAYEDQILCAPYDNREYGDDDAHEKGIWLDYNSRLVHDISSMHFLNQAKEYQRLQGFDCNIEKTDHGYILSYNTGTPPYIGKKVYCNPKGYMYVCPGEDTALVGGRDHINDDGERTDVAIDVDNNILTLPDGTSVPFGDLLYNPTNSTYHIGVLDQSTNITYNYSWTYNITHTSITYIGQTEEYSKYYELYYELPDGRSSADLTAEELEQLNVGIDVLPYIRSTDDVHLRALYHFDGDVKDSSYWNHLSSFEWTDGASITYMDAGVFEGALYLDEQSHRFVITLPKNIASSDFTLQWRMYQSATPAPVSDTNIAVGGQMLLKSDGSHWLNNGGTQIASIPVGSWCEYAIVRSSSGLHFFVNGLKVYTWASSLATASYTNKLIFNFGAGQQTYKYFDELRVVTKALYSTAGYTPTAVPHDTNLALVLPDSKLPVADAYWSFESSKTNLLEQYSLSNWVNWADGEKPNLIADNWWNDASFTVKYDSSNRSAYRYQVYPFFSRISDAYSNTDGEEFPKFWYGLNSTSVFSDTSGTHLSIGGISSSYEYYSPNWSVFTGAYVKRLSENIQYAPTGGMVTYFDVGFADGSFPSTLEAGKTYTLSMVSAEGEVGSFTFEMPALGSKVSGYNAYTISGDQLTPISESQYLTTVSTSGTNYYFANSGYEHFAFVGEYLFNDYYFIVYPAVAEERYAGSSNEYYLPHYIMQIVPVVSNDTYNSTTGRYEGGDFVYLELVEGESDLKAEYVESIAVMDKDDINTPSLAVKTDIEITGHQIGGMRPSVPQKGLVWALVEGGIIKSLQIYNGSAWEPVDGRIWTGSRWVPYSAYNVLLLKDLYDVAGTVSPEDFEYIYTETGFWSWWQKSWLDFVSWIKGTGGTGSDNPSSDQQPDDSVIPPVDEDGDGEGEGWQFIDLLVLLKDGAWAVGKGIVVTVFDGISGLATAVDGVGGFFDSYSSGGSVFQIYEEGEGIWD